MKKYLGVLFFSVFSTLVFAESDAMFRPRAVFGDVSLKEGENLIGATSVATRIVSAPLQLKAPLKFKSFQTPSYPENLFNAGSVGECEVTFDLLDDGSVIHIQPGKFSDKEFVESAIRAVKQWRFEPLKRLSGNGAPKVTATFFFSKYM